MAVWSVKGKETDRLKKQNVGEITVRLYKVKPNLTILSFVRVEEF